MFLVTSLQLPIDIMLIKHSYPFLALLGILMVRIRWIGDHQVLESSTFTFAPDPFQMSKATFVRFRLLDDINYLSFCHTAS